MIQVRQKDGTTVQAEGFVEIVTPDGMIGVLVYEDGTGRIKIVKSGDEEAYKYEKLFGVKFARVEKQ